ncbi:hypothetical protein MHBO_001128 [Bonamia ostreae]|uniref:Uncharacterized protein n=1 Tax=Bonamia ostreae TaxID=126728 RepID=A0ABV2AIE3_9EUKA
MNPTAEDDESEAAKETIAQNATKKPYKCKRPSYNLPWRCKSLIALNKGCSPCTRSLTSLKLENVGGYDGPITLLQQSVGGKMVPRNESGRHLEIEGKLGDGVIGEKVFLFKGECLGLLGHLRRDDLHRLRPSRGGGRRGRRLAGRRRREPLRWDRPQRLLSVREPRLRASRLRK